MYVCMCECRMSEVPTWMFIQHAAQFIGSLDQPEGPIVAEILLRVTTGTYNTIHIYIHTYIHTYY